MAGTPPPPEILKLSMVLKSVYMLLNISMCHQNVVWKYVPDCVRSNLKGCKFKIFLGEGGGACVSHATIILLPSPQLKILYETLHLGMTTDKISSHDGVRYIP